MRTKRLAQNTVSSLIYQITTIISGFILPRLILQYYGSEINGLVNSINQFLAIISFLELGVGAVVQSALYSPLAQNDNLMISKIMRSAEKFFRKLAQILLVYVIVLLVVYPNIARQNYDWIYTDTLIICISISSFAQYYFGVVDQLLLSSDQKGYIQYNTQIFTIVLNTIASVFLISIGFSIHIVKLATSIIYLIRPAFLRLYVKKYYKINRRIQYEGEPIRQKWNGVAQHIAAVVLDSTDLIVLTTFESLSAVSIYSVYHLVVYGVKQLFMSMTNGIQALLGELWAKQELYELKKTFGWTEWIIHTIATIIFGCTATLLVPFISIYTYGVTDANYIQPLFATLITIAHAIHCLRLPYSIMILASGHYKETQHSYIWAAILNISISVITVKIWGLIGVAIGTIAAMTYHTVWMAVYTSKNLIKWPFTSFLKQLLADSIIIAISHVLCLKIQMVCIIYFAWIIMAMQVGIIWLLVSLLVNYIIYKERIRFFFIKTHIKE